MTKRVFVFALNCHSRLSAVREKISNCGNCIGLNLRREHHNYVMVCATTEPRKRGTRKPSVPKASYRVTQITYGVGFRYAVSLSTSSTVARRTELSSVDICTAA